MTGDKIAFKSQMATTCNSLKWKYLFWSNMCWKAEKVTTRCVSGRLKLYKHRPQKGHPFYSQFSWHLEETVPDSSVFAVTRRHWCKTTHLGRNLLSAHLGVVDKMQDPLSDLSSILPGGTHCSLPAFHSFPQIIYFSHLNLYYTSTYRGHPCQAKEGCPDGLYFLHPWRFWGPNWIKPCAHWSNTRWNSSLQILDHQVYFHLQGVNQCRFTCFTFYLFFSFLLL